MVPDSYGISPKASAILGLGFGIGQWFQSYTTLLIGINVALSFSKFTSVSVETGVNTPIKAT